MHWWCSASGQRWTWAWTAYPGVWLVSLLLALVYWRVTRGADKNGRWVSGWIGVILIWLSLDWPLGPLGAGYIASVHALQFVFIALAAPPLILRGIAPQLRQWLPLGSMRERIAGGVTQPLMAAVIFNLAAIVTHVPKVVDLLMRNQPGAFAIDMMWLIGGLVFWWPVVLDIPARRHFPPLAKIVYIFLGTMVHTGVAIVMLMARFPIYGIYELAPPTGWLSPIDDLEVAGGIMELGGAVVVFGIITVLFFRWANRAE
jgi:putative membrane protein